MLSIVRYPKSIWSLLETTNNFSSLSYFLGVWTFDATFTTILKCNKLAKVLKLWVMTVEKVLIC